MEKWHNRFVHLNYTSLQKMAKNGMVFGLDANMSFDIKDHVCETCAKCKRSENRSAGILDLVHTDICGPMNKPSIGGARYFATFIVDKTRYVSVCFLKTRDEIFDKFNEFKVFAETQTGMKLKSIRSDNGREYVSEKFSSFLVSNGIKRQLTVPYTPQQNAVAERANRTLVEMARSMLIHVDEMFWAEAINTAAYLRNRSETSTLPGVTPYEAWSGKKPSVSHLRLFGAKAIVLDKTHRKKFKPKGVEYMLVGYSETAKAYRFQNLENQSIIDARDVIFLEDDLVKHGSEAAANVADVKLAELQDQSECDT